MFNRWFLLSLVLLMLTANRAASDDRALVNQGFLKAEDYLELPPKEQSIYAMGLVDGMYLAPVFDAPNEGKYLHSLHECLSEMTNRQVAAIITKFAKEHPEKWHMGTNALAYQSLRLVCPVPPSGQGQ
jgi:hypothetical protein